MERREALRNVALLVGGGLVLSSTTMSVLFDGCKSPSKKTIQQLFTEDQQAILTEFADIIIPTTSCPGAKAAGIGPFITMMIKDCYPDDVQKSFLQSLSDFEKSSKKKLGKSFIEASGKERESLVADLRNDILAAKKLDKAQAEKDKAAGKIHKTDPALANNFFVLTRDLTIMGYFSSEIGATQARAYVPVPGRYDGCVDLKPGQKAWA